MLYVPVMGEESHTLPPIDEWHVVSMQKGVVESVPLLDQPRLSMLLTNEIATLSGRSFVRYIRPCAYRHAAAQLHNELILHDPPPFPPNALGGVLSASSDGSRVN